MKNVDNAYDDCIRNLVSIEHIFLLNIFDCNDLKMYICHVKNKFKMNVIDCKTKFEKEKILILFLLLERLKTTISFENKLVELVNYFVDTYLATISKHHVKKSVKHNEENRNKKTQKQEVISLATKLPTQLNIKLARSNYSQETTNTLLMWLQNNVNKPYPSSNEKIMLSELTGLSVLQVNNWFINARRRILKYFKN
ncbi:hypothetical protein PAEPH01_0432 [Pancytospora epiphaga]|nr:hypothetical protein PAEPH01_0432 [Pancytospora epiphaga]